jgi:hypothetical protein
MSVAPADMQAAAATRALLLQSDAALADKLALGQVIQGLVLRHYEGSRYLVRFLGHERVVESAAPLKPNEIFFGRVTTLRDRIELERLEREAPAALADASTQALEESWLALGAGRAAQVIEELFQRYRGTLEPREAERLRRLVGRAARPERMALAGLVLAKAGLPLEAPLAQSLYAVLDSRAGSLAPLADPESWPPAQWVLNAQAGGSVAHRAGTLRLEAGDAVIEVQAALFEEDRPAAPPAGIQHRKLVLVFETERLGRIELRAVMAERHIRVALATETPAAAAALRRHDAALARGLAAAGWQVDETSYETRSASDHGNAVAAAAAEHLVTPGSVERLL